MAMMEMQIVTGKVLQCVHKDLPNLAVSCHLLYNAYITALTLKCVRVLM